jgi:hypothetical protein
MARAEVALAVRLSGVTSVGDLGRIVAPDVAGVEGPGELEVRHVLGRDRFAAG